MADMAGKAAERVERMSGYLDDEDPSAMVEDLENLGRRNPGAFVGSAFATGLAAGRFLRASRPARTDGPSRARATTMPTEKPGASWPREHEPAAGREAQSRARPPATGERTLPATSGVPATGGEE